LLRETRETSSRSDESVVNYVLSTQEKLQGMENLVAENLSKAQDQQKRWYDKARVRGFSIGDPVLVLLPTRFWLSGRDHNRY
jgi:hypothetical protein